MKLILQYIFSFILLVLVQVLVLNNIHFLGIANPYFYILFIITLPLETPRPLLLSLAFLLGLSIDIFSNTPGLHTFTTVFTAFVCMKGLKLFIPREDSHNRTNFIPSMRTMGIAPFFKYSVLIVLIHHTVLFSIEAFSFQHIWLLILRILASSTFTLILLLAIERFKLRK